MSQTPPLKLIPRNAAAFRKGRSAEAAVRPVAGNPVSTRLESGVGNCFPGLECDLRNLERRFFPFLEADISDNEIRIVAVDAAGAEALAQGGGLPAALAQDYRRLAGGVAAGQAWTVERMTGTFGPLGPLALNVAALGLPSLGPDRRPPDAWVAIRMLTEGAEVVLDLIERDGGRMQLAGLRSRYLDDNGSLSEIFRPGELSQSLCSPWTHDFRDCGCFYWASNHPDIAQPVLPSPPPDAAAWNANVVWQRSDRKVELPPPPAASRSPRPLEMDHYEINEAWQSLYFVLGRRETVAPVQPREVSGKPLGSRDILVGHLRYAAGVELAVAQEYLTAAYSLRRPDGLPAPLRDDIRAAHAEFMRIAIGEMRHIRAVNDVLASLPPLERFQPALQVAAVLPGREPGQTRPVEARPAKLAVIDDFIDIERPSVSVDGLYADILATLELDGTDEQEQTVRSIMAEGEDHFQTFDAIREWLGRHDEGAFLRSTNPVRPDPVDPDHRLLQTRYRALLERLHRGYALRVPAGAPDINAGRFAMLGPDGIHGAAEAVADRGLLVVFDPPDDPRFAPIPAP